MPQLHVPEHVNEAALHVCKHQVARKDGCPERHEGKIYHQQDETLISGMACTAYGPAALSMMNLTASKCSFAFAKSPHRASAMTAAPSPAVGSTWLSLRGISQHFSHVIVLISLPLEDRALITTEVLRSGICLGIQQNPLQRNLVHVAISIRAISDRTECCILMGSIDCAGHIDKVQVMQGFVFPRGYAWYRIEWVKGLDQKSDRGGRLFQEMLLMACLKMRTFARYAGALL